MLDSWALQVRDPDLPSFFSNGVTYPSFIIEGVSKDKSSIRSNQILQNIFKPHFFLVVKRNKEEIPSKLHLLI